MAAQCQEDGGGVRDSWLRPMLTLIFLPYFRLPHLAKVSQIPFPAGTAIIRSPRSTNSFSNLDEGMPGFSFNFQRLFFYAFVRPASCYYYFLLFVQQYRHLFSIRLSWSRIVCLFVLHLCNILQGSENVVLDWDWFLSCRSCCCCHGFCRRFLFVVYSLYIVLITILLFYAFFSVFQTTI